jgi:hypothetical protein
MSAGTASDAVTPLRLTRGVAEKRIRKAAQASENVILGNHARQRMLERGIDDVDVHRVLRTGGIVEDPEPAETGEWKCKFVQKVRGGRDVGVVVIILRDGKLFVKTVEWEDR